MKEPNPSVPTTACPHCGTAMLPRADDLGLVCPRHCAEKAEEAQITTDEISLDKVILQIEYLVTRKQASRALLDAAYRERIARSYNDECHSTQDVVP